MRRLPSLAGVEAFVHVARLGSVKAAAEELALSSPALSRRIQSLERFVGRPLFDRRHQAIVANDDGEKLMHLVGPILDSLTDAIETLTSPSPVMRLRLGVLPLFAAQRLFPRLAELREKHPSLHIDVDTAAHGVSRLGDGLDAAIVLSREIDPALYARRLDRNTVLAIGARRLLQGPHAIKDPAQLSEMTVLIHREMPDTFDAWRDALKIKNLEPAAIDHFDSGQLMLEAAAQGLGIAFMHQSHLDDAHDERLVRIFDVDVESPYSYWFVCRPRALQLEPVRIFHDWLVSLSD
ncbi:MAG: LysR family transcriptional regulator [Sphingomonadales bacterium]|jgi:LysR family transcriptional regulator, glycine cleavage system transcriptional activator|nr:LysR family transcriptional regulator [Sphingomonadales bacterium]MBK9587790.1 LysR family transcriptional regulator [Sphingomonadales bacterium]